MGNCQMFSFVIIWYIISVFTKGQVWLVAHTHTIPATSSPSDTSFTSDPTETGTLINEAFDTMIPLATLPDMENPMGMGSSFLRVICNMVCIVQNCSSRWIMRTVPLCLLFLMHRHLS